jgi:serine/threonine protein kinase/WD40 repeat protein
VKPNDPQAIGPALDTLQAPVVDIPPSRVGGLARLAFGSVSSAFDGDARHLAFLPIESLELDLEDPEQRDFGDYELLERLGQGGMGVVYRARQRSLQREVALKLLAAGPWASPEFVDRFRREAQSAARLQHPNIVAIFEIGSHAELNYFTMALVRGRSLSQWLEAGPLPERRAAALLRTVAEAIDHAHRLGILHLDLKPANILIDEHGEPQVADFGLARRLGETLGSERDEVSGTPSYMAPEQVRPGTHPIGRATDIYGLGAVLYEALSARPPFLAASARATLEQVMDSAVEPLRRQVPGLAEDLEAICQRCLAKDPGQRYGSARDLADDLARFLEGRAVSVRPLSRWQRARRWSRREPRLAIAIGFALCALLIGLGATSLQWRRADASAAAAQASLWSVRSQSAQSSLSEGDGFRALRALVANLGEMEASGAPERALLERQRIGTVLANAPQLVDLIRLPPGESVSSVAISPDGQQFAVASHADSGSRWLRQFSLASGEQQWQTSTDGLTHGLPFASGTPHGQLYYSPDGSRLLARLTQMPVFAAPSGADGIAVDARSGRVLSPPDLDEAHSDIVYSDDVRIALVRFRAEPGRRFPDSGQFHAVEPWRPLGPRIAFDGPDAHSEWLPAPDGRWFLGTSDFCRFELIDPHSGERVWQLQLPADDPVRAWRFNADASQLALGTEAGVVHLVDTREAGRRELPASAVATLRWLEFSADGRTLAGKAEDGTLVAWDLPSLRPRTTPLAGGGTDYAKLRIIGDRLLSAGERSLRSWTLPAPAPFANVAVPALVQLRNRRHFWNHAFDLHPPGRWLVAGGSDGYIGLWREPAPSLLPVGAAPLPPRNVRFDGQHILAVDSHVAQLLEVDTLAPRSPAFRHSEPVRLAELSADGSRLVTVAGRTVRVLDPATGALVGSPIVLPQTPLRADLAQEAPVLLLGTGEYVGDVFHERLHVIDLERAQLRTDAVLLPGPLHEVVLGPDGRFALVADGTDQRPHAALKWVDLDGASRSCTELRMQGLAVGAIALATDGRSGWFYLQLPQRRGRLVRWDLERCRELTRIDLQQGTVLPTLRSHGTDVLAYRQAGNGLTWFSADGSRRDLPGAQQDGGMQEFALSRDGRRAAVALRNAVQLIDLAQGERVSGMLSAPIAGNDAIAKLAFSPDGARLLARTVRGRWLHWRLPVNTQERARLELLARVLDPGATDPIMSEAALVDLRRQLRQEAAGDAPPAAAVPATVELPALPAARIDPRFVPLDLRSAINVPLSGPWPRQPATGGDRPTLTAGVQRLLDIDWRIEGGVQLSWGGSATALHPTQASSAVIPVPALQLQRVHVLTHMHIPIRPQAPTSPYAHVVLIDARGRETRLEMRLYEHVVTHRTPELALPSARIGWAGIDSASVRAGYATSSDISSYSFAVSLDVPDDIEPIVGLRLQTADGPMEAPLFHAITLELAKPPGPRL